MPVSISSVMSWLETIFAPPNLMLMVTVGLWSALVVSRALMERNLPREARWAYVGGWFYIILAATAFVIIRGYRFFF